MPDHRFYEQSTNVWNREWVDDSTDGATSDDTNDVEEYRRVMGTECDAMYAHRAWEGEQQASDADVHIIGGDF